MAENQMSCLILSLLIFLHCSIRAFGAECGGSDWSIYNNEKCFKIVDQFVNRTGADVLCRSEIGADRLVPEILTIKNPSEQEFVEKFVFESGEVFDSFWIGARKNEEGKFEWDNDGSPVVYTNWAPEHPTDNMENECLQLTSKVGKNKAEVDDGLWKDVPCNKRNLVVCQKGATLSIPEIQAVLFDLKNNPVPLGFIYTQLPNKPSPQSIWPNLVWKSVTAEYAGLFFRAEGGTSGKFGEEQGESTKRLKSIHNRQQAGHVPNWGEISPVPGEWTSLRTIAYWTEGMGTITTSYHMRFLLSNDEVKPRNTAVRIWERIQ
jgi:hypothetical protein